MVPCKWFPYYSVDKWPSKVEQSCGGINGCSRSKHPEKEKNYPFQIENCLFKKFLDRKLNLRGFSCFCYINDVHIVGERILFRIMSMIIMSK